jgi:transcriptional regulator with XRE-family HTH domain
MKAAGGIDELLERVRARRQLPQAEERRRIRVQAGVSLRDVANALGVSHSLVRYWEQGGMPREQRAAYAELLDRLEVLGAKGPPAEGVMPD